MKEQKRGDIGFFCQKIYLSWFGSGYAPVAPGTFGSAASLPLLWLFHHYMLSSWMVTAIVTFMTILACWIADRVQRRLKVQDPQWIVIDEVIGMIITWVILRPTNAWEWVAVFAAFRFFDIVKIWPASFFDKRVKNGAGTILDDVVSGLYAGFFLLILSNFVWRTTP